MRIRAIAQKQIRKLFAEVDVLVTPSRFGPAPKIGEPLDRRPDENTQPKDRGLSALIPAGNLAGLPALSLPCGFADSLPVAIQVVGPAFSENALIALGKEFQTHTDWHRKRPPVST
jgi:aspartyl-tRNA(Asn)/glutamyl-tRNA(Gln) amidotransferase subunit A